MHRALVALSLVLFTAGAAAQDELARLRAEQRDQAARAIRLSADAQAAQAAAAQAETALARTLEAEATDDPALASQRERLRALSAREAALLPALAQERTRQGRLLSALQSLTKSPPPPLVASPRTISDTIRAARLMQALAPEIAARAARLEAQRATIGGERRLAILASGALIASDSAAAERQARLEATAARASAQAALLAAEAERARRTAAELERRIRGLGGAPAPAPTRAAAALPAGRSSLTPPVPGKPAARFSSGSSGWRWPADGTAVIAPAAGRVAYAGPLAGWNQVVILDLGPGWRVVVAGLGRLEVASGQAVSDGQRLGRAPEDGQVWFELRLDERPIDPAPWLE